jgi:membrane protein DedA with SNARE-associated domain
MQVISEVILLIMKYQSLVYWIILLAALLGGEELIILFALLAGYGVLNIWKVSIIGFFGIIVADTLWFAFARTPIFEWIKRKAKKHANGYYKHANYLVEKFSHRHDFVYIFLTKFVYGLRIVSIMKVSRRKKSFLKFLTCDALAILAWELIVIPIGFVLGHSFFSVVNVLDDANKLVILGILLLAVLFLVEKVIRDKLD